MSRIFRTDEVWLQGDRDLCDQASSLSPLLKDLVSAVSMIGGTDEMAADIKGVVNGGVNGDEALGGAMRSEALHLPLSKSDGNVRAFGSVILPAGADTDAFCDSGPLPKTITEMAMDDCMIIGDVCWTRTPGYWATHMREAEFVVNLMEGIPTAAS